MRSESILVVVVGVLLAVANVASATIDTFGTGKISEERLVEIVREHFDLRPYGITKMLDLLHPMLQGQILIWTYQKSKGDSL